MTNYEELLNNREGIDPVSIQGIYNMIYAPEISVYTIKNFAMGIKLIDEAVTKHGTRAVVVVQELGAAKYAEIPLKDVDPQLREVMVIGRRFWNHVRDENMVNDYRHFGLPDSGIRLGLEKNLTVPGDGRRAGDLAELGIAMREHLGLYKR